MVLTEAGRLGVAGALAGVAVAIVGSRVLDRLIWGVPRVDPVTYAVVFMVLVCAALAAAFAPARRAARSDVMETLRI